MSESGNDNENTGTNRTLVLDEHRGMAAQKETDARRQQSAVTADQDALKERRHSLEKHLFAEPAATLSQATEKAAYLLRVFAATGEAQDPRFQQMIEDVLEDFRRLDDGGPKPAP